jgi:hypothetical protein
VEYPLDAPGTLILSDRPVRYCRFCERTATHTVFGSAGPVVAGGLESSLFSEAVCEECRSAFRGALSEEFRLFQVAILNGISDAASGDRLRASAVYSSAVFKALVTCALTIMPESELRYFVDALEWVSNPDSERDAPLLRERASCRVYSAEFLRQRSWTSLARRTENDAPFPYMIFFLCQGGVLIQVQVPLCIRDQDLDGRPVRIARRSLISADDHPFEQTRIREFRLGEGFGG